MTTVRDTARRRGFTLIEVLVVLAIIAILAAMGAGVFFTIRGGAQKTATEAAMIKLNTALDRRTKAILDTAREDVEKGRVPPVVMAFAGNDRDRALTVWSYFKLKNALPTTFEEARGGACPNPSQTDLRRGIWLWDGNTANPAVLALERRAVFTTLPNPATPPPLEHQSAVCLYVALNSGGDRGEVAGVEGLENQTGNLDLGGGTKGSAFFDGYGSPIAFARQAYAVELSNPTYNKTPTTPDPLDKTRPSGKLTSPTSTWTNASLIQFWRIIAGDPASAATRNVYPLHLPYNGFPQFNSAGTTGGYTSPPALPRNWVVSTISAGPNMKFIDPAIAANDAAARYSGGRLLGGDDPSDDNLLSFRLRQQNASGD